MSRLDQQFRVEGDTVVGPTYFNGLLTVLEGRFVPLEGQQADLEAAEQRLLDVGLARLDNVLTPALNKLFSVLQSGFLLAHSATPQLLVVGQQPTFVVPEGSERDFFVPTPFVTLSRTSTPADYAFARTVAYDASQGTFTAVILSVTGDPGPHSDWLIQDGTGVADAVAAMLAQATAARDATIELGDAIKAQADADAGAAAASATAAAGSATAAAGSATSAGTSAGAAATAADHAAQSAASVDTSTFAKKDGSTAFTGVQRGVAPASGDRSNALVTSAFLGAAIDVLLGGAPGALDTLKELADALGDDANFAATVSTALGNRLRFDAAQSLTAPQKVQVAANLGLSIFSVSGVIAKANAFSASDANGTLYDLTGSFAATLPAASGGTASAPIWRHFRKRDGSGACTMALSGTDAWEDGTTAAKSLYQESCTVFAIGTGKWFFAPGTRQRGWVNIGTTTTVAAMAAVSITTGFADPELRDMEFVLDNVVPSASDYPIVRLNKSGSYLTAGYSTAGFAAGNSTSASNLFSTSVPITFNASAGAVQGRSVVYNFQAVTTQRVYNEGFNTTEYWTTGTLTGTQGAAQGWQLSMSGGANINAGAVISQRGFRP